MILVKRGACPASLLKNKGKWDGELAIARKSGDKNRIKKAEGNYAQADVKAELEVLFREKCAYCESEINSVSYGHIEHFRPKSRFPAYCFEWTNLLLACGRCNSKAHKGDKFPETSDGGPFIDPSVEDPGVHLNFVYGAIAKLALVEPKTTRGRTTTTIFGLNTRKALLKRRTNWVRNILALKVLAGNDPEALELLANAKASTAEFSAWASSLA